MSGKRGFKIILGTLLIGAMLVALTFLSMADWLQGPKISNAPQKLPDGTILKLVQIDFGKTNLALDDGLFERLRRRYVPPAGLTIVGRQLIPPLPPATNYNVALNANGELVFALQHLGLTNSSPSAAFSQTQIDWQANAVAVAFDELGREYVGGTVRFDLGMIKGVTNPVSAWHLPAFPREGKLVGLRLFRRASYGAEWKPVAEFVTRNPSPGPHPRWVPDLQPVTHHVGKLGITLRDLVVHKSSGGAVSQRPDYRAEVTILITENGRPTDAWRPVAVVLTEANGNRAESPLLGGTTNANGTVFRFTGALDPEATWKLSVELDREKGLAESELWQVHDMPPPPSFQQRMQSPASPSKMQAFSTNLNGASLTLTFISRDTMMARAVRPAPGWRMSILSVVDEQGRDMTRGARVPSGTSFVASLNIPDDVKTVNATMAYQKSSFVEFVVKPRVEILNTPERIPRLVNPITMAPGQYSTNRIPSQPIRLRVPDSAFAPVPPPPRPFTPALPLGVPGDPRLSGGSSGRIPERTPRVTPANLSGTNIPPPPARGP